ncbi:hypothetical protein [Marinomonas arenicola]|uniref:Uncharacterized protein n=1 Tax=Marinomonas arenicola TaxID=569601 RepID=A0ABU9G732_9GAMM
MPKDIVVSTYSSVISALAEAIDAYPPSPKSGLINIKCALSDLSHCLVANNAPDIVCERTRLGMLSVDNVISKQPIYDSKLAVALYEMADSLEQYTLAWALGEAYVGLTLSLFTEERFCWRLLAQKKSLARTLPCYLYEGRLSVSSPLDITDAMACLSAIGKVSFHLDEDLDSVGTGCFHLCTVQPLDWLRVRFANFTWRYSATDENEPKVAFLLSSYGATFLSEALPQRQRRALLASISESIRTHYYVEFSDYFSSIERGGKLVNGERLVPRSLSMLPIAVTAGQVARPVRIAGYHYLQIGADSDATSVAESKGDLASNKVCLGRDLLSSWLYVVDVGEQWWAFDQADFVGCFALQNTRFQQTDSGWKCYFETGIGASLHVNADLFLIEDGVFQCLNDTSLELFVINQDGRYVAVAIKSLHQEEGICAVSYQVGKRIKNIWLTAKSRRFIEPWLAEYLLPEVKRVPGGEHSAQKTGYYQVALKGGLLWIEANLVLDIVSTASHSLLGSFSTGEGERESALLYGMEYFNRIVLCQNEVVNRMVLLLDGCSLAFQAPLFTWCARLPDQVAMADVSHLSVLSNSDGLCVLGCNTAYENNFVINTNTISDFIHYLWPQHSLESVSNYD